eukprot:Opistho-2@77927
MIKMRPLIHRAGRSGTGRPALSLTVTMVVLCGIALLSCSGPGSAAAALRPYYIPPECIFRTSLTVFANDGETTVICTSSTQCFLGKGPVDPLNLEAVIDADYWTPFVPPTVANFFEALNKGDQILAVTGEDGFLYGILDAGLYVSTDNGTSFSPYLVWDCNTAAVTPQCPIVNPTYDPIPPRPDKTLQCSQDAKSTLSVDDQTSNAFYMTWGSQETSTDTRYFLECDNYVDYDSGLKQISSITPSATSNYKHGQYMTVASLGLRPSSTIANTRDDYFVWWKTSASDSGPLTGTTPVFADISGITTAGDVCNAVVKALFNAGIAGNSTGLTTADNVVRATCDGSGNADLNIEQLVSGAIPVHQRLHRGTVMKSTSSATAATGVGSVGYVGPEYATLTITGPSMTNGAASGGAVLGPKSIPSNGNWYIGNAKSGLWEYFYFYNNGGCADNKAVVNTTSSRIHRIDVTGVSTTNGIADAINTAANAIDGFTAGITLGADTKQTHTLTAAARSRLLDGSQFFIVDETGKLWTWYFDKSGNRTSPLTQPANPSGVFTRIDISSANGRTTANEIAVSIRDAINGVYNTPFNATIAADFKTPIITVTQNALAVPATRGRVTIAMLDSTAMEPGVGGIIPLMTVEGAYFRVCFESDGKADVGSFVGSCKKNTTAAGSIIEVVLVTGATAQDNAAALTLALNTPANYPGGIVPFLAEQGVGVNTDKVYVWQRAPGNVPIRSVATISGDNPSATPDGMSFVLVSQDGTFSPRLCYERNIGTCNGASIKVNRNDTYIAVRTITSGSDPTVTLDVGHGFGNDDLVVFLETNDGGGASKLAQRGFRVASKSGNQFKLISNAAVTTTSAGNTGKAYKAAGATDRVSDATTNTDADGTITKSGHGLSNDDVIFFTGEASAVANFAGGKLCLVASVGSGTFKCGGKINTASETGVVYYKVADDSTKIAVSSVTVGANPTITTSAQHRLEVGDVLIYPFPRNAMSQLVDGGVWQHKFFRVASVPTLTTLTVTPSITTTTTAAGYIFRGVIDSKTFSPRLQARHGCARRVSAPL